MEEVMSDTVPLVIKKGAGFAAVEPVVVKSGSTLNNSQNNGVKSSINTGGKTFESFSTVGGSMTKSVPNYSRKQRSGSAWSRVVNSSNKQLYAVGAAMCIMLGVFIMLMLSSFLSGSKSSHNNKHSSSSHIDSAVLNGDVLEGEHGDMVTNGWSRLETTWASPQDDGFYSVPLNLSEAEASPDWTLVSSCSEGDSRTGELFSQDGELGAMPMYHRETGALLGLITGAELWNATYENSVWNTYTLNDGTKYSGVQYLFRDAAFVCSEGNEDDLEEAQAEKTIGDRLLIRTSTETNTEADFYSAPLSRDTDLLENDGWTAGTCFPRMGEHWWRYVNDDCDNNFEVFLLYNRGGLTAFGVATTNSNFPHQTEKRWETVAGTSTRFFYYPKDQPECLNDIPELSTMHVYLDDPARMNCIF